MSKTEETSIAAGSDFEEQDGIFVPTTEELRDKRGLLKNVEYKFREDGTVDWRAMIPEEFLYINKGWFEARKMPVPKTTEGLEDKQLLVLLGGIKHVARLRGYQSVDYEFAPHSTPEHVAVKCTIHFIENFETKLPQAFMGGGTTKFSSLANATMENLSDFVMKFPETIAENRAFVRCVRNFLNINIVGDDEIDKGAELVDTEGSSPNKKNLPSEILRKLATQKLSGDIFDDFKDELRALYKQKKYKPTVDPKEITTWKDYTDIPKAEVRNIIGTIQKL
jgi:hypothetical protein